MSIIGSSDSVPETSLAASGCSLVVLTGWAGHISLGQVAFMGIGLVDPILKPIADNLNASPSQVSLLFTSYMAVMGVAMLITGVVASRIGPKRTLLFGLLIIIAGAGLAGMSDSVAEIVGWRALWGLGNALFIATALATIVSSARGSVS